MNKKTVKTEKTPYTKDKVCRLSFRVNETLYAWVGERAKELGVTPCDFARNGLYQMMASEKLLARVG